MKREEGAGAKAPVTASTAGEWPVVVKLGGSLAKNGELHGWLAALEACGADRVVVVPGGGSFADQVRDAQRGFGFDDATAHRMAILAMEQFGLMLCGLCGRLVAAGSAAEINAALARGAIALWLPSAMTKVAPDIPRSWEVTSDSLAAWLATRLDSQRLVLVKSVDPQRLRGSIGELANAGVVDRALPDFATGQLEIEVLGNGQYARLTALLSALT